MSPLRSVLAERRDPVDHFLIDRGAQSRRISAVAFEGRLGARFPHQPLGQHVEFRSRDTRSHGARQLTENARHELIGARIRASSAEERHTINCFLRSARVRSRDHRRLPTTDATAAAMSAATESSV